MPTYEKAFKQVKKAGDNNKILQPLWYNNSSNVVYLFTDASLTGTGTWVGQEPTPERAKPAFFHSRKLTPTHTNYPTFQIETLAIIDVVHAFDELLAGHHFTIITDHESLTNMRKQKRLGGRQQRWVDFLSRYDFDIIYRKGKTNYLADALSRLHEGEPTPTDHFLKDPIDNDTESETDTTTSSQYSAMTSSKTSYGSGSWDAQDEQRII